MDSSLIVELVKSVNQQLINTIIQFCAVLFILMSIKSMVSSVVDYWKVRASDFGRESHIEIFGKRGYIKKVSLREVEIHLDDNKSVLLIPLENFLKANKIIFLNSQAKRGKK